jgi:RNA polymerase sigma factor (sigma-70 family)
MEDRELLANRFEEHRPRLRALAHRMLGSQSESDDAVQEAWLRLDRSDSGGVENLGGWLTTVVGRVCLNMLRSRGSRWERLLSEPSDETPNARMPDPIVDREDGIDPEHQALLADGIGLALLSWYSKRYLPQRG